MNTWFLLQVHLAMKNTQKINTHEIDTLNKTQNLKWHYTKFKNGIIHSPSLDAWYNVLLAEN